MLLKLIILCVFITQVVKAQTPDEVTFHLFTRNNPDKYVKLVTGKLEGMSINVRKPFKIIIHGYEDSVNSNWMEVMKNEYLKKDEYNVIQVDWAPLAGLYFKQPKYLYDEAANNTRIAGKHLADLFIDLKKIFALSLKNVHLIGNGLGAHVSGFAAKNIINSGFEKIARITGMDAASPLFYLSPTNERLAIGDADFIDCIHTDNFKFGNGTTLGDADFYPDGGNALEPGCTINYTKLDLPSRTSCRTCLSYQYFIRSINSNEFKSKQCKSHWNFITGQCNSNPFTIMGDNVDLSARGSYYRLSSLCYYDE